MARRRPAWLSALAAALILAGPAGAADYTGPLIDAHSHVPNAVAIDVYVEAMKRHNVSEVVLLGVTQSVARHRGRPLDPAWKALIERIPERFLMGIDVWSPRFFEPAMLDRLMSWTRRVLGQLKPEIATRVAATNAVRVFRIEEAQR